MSKRGGAAAVYFGWLVGQIHVGYGRTSKTYNDLFRVMHETEFVWSVPNDDNRVEDALDLRNEFAANMSGEPIMMGHIHTHVDKGASFLEVLVALSRHLAFNGGGTQEGWAWHLVVNLELTRMSDPLGPRQEQRLRDALEAVVWRTYDRDGQGGFFPLGFPQDDQRNVELWYQMSMYIAENSDPHG